MVLEEFGIKVSRSSETKGADILLRLSLVKTMVRLRRIVRRSPTIVYLLKDEGGHLIDRRGFKY